MQPAALMRQTKKVVTTLENLQGDGSRDYSGMYEVFPKTQTSETSSATLSVEAA